MFKDEGATLAALGIQGALPPCELRWLIEPSGLWPLGRHYLYCHYFQCTAHVLEAKLSPSCTPNPRLLLRLRLPCSYIPRPLTWCDEVHLENGAAEMAISIESSRIRLR